MYFDTKKEVEKTKKIMKNPKLEIEDARRGLEKLQQYIKKLKEQGTEDEKIRQKINDEFSQEINEYLKTGQTDTAKFFIMLSNRMGHSIQVMQDTYMHLFPTIQDEIVDLLNNL